MSKLVAGFAANQEGRAVRRRRYYSVVDGSTLKERSKREITDAWYCCVSNRERH